MSTNANSIGTILIDHELSSLLNLRSNKILRYTEIRLYIDYTDYGKEIFLTEMYWIVLINN